MPVWGLVLSLLAATLWAVSPILMKEGLKSAGANEINPIRSVGFVVTMSLILLATKPDHLPSATLYLWLAMALNIGISYVLGDLLYIHSINIIGASLAVSISSAYPLISTFFSIWVLDEHITLLVWSGTITIIAGLIVIQYASTSKFKKYVDDKTEAQRKRDTSLMLKGFILAVAAAVCWGANIPFTKSILVTGGWTPVEYYFLRSIGYSVIVWGLRAVQVMKFKETTRPLRRVSFRAWGALLIGGSIALAIGGLLFAVCINVLPVSIVTPITAASPFITVLLARAIHKEKLSRLQLVGVTCVIVGSIAVSL